MTDKKEIAEGFKVHTRYYDKKGNLLPGVTTIVSDWGEKGGTIMNWAWRMDLDGIDIYDYMHEMKAIGKLAHSIITDGLAKRETDYTRYSQEQIDAAQNSALSYYEWKKGHKIEPLVIETSFVSDKWGYGGTIDIYGVIEKNFELIDLKTGSGVYPSHFVQIAAYRELLQENGYKVDRCRILNIPRTEDEAFQEVIVTNLDTWFEIFKGLLMAYKEYQKIKPKYKKKGKENPSHHLFHHLHVGNGYNT